MMQAPSGNGTDLEPVTAAFRCRACGEVASTLSLLRAHRPERAALDAGGLLVSSREVVSGAAAAALEEALRVCDARALHALDRLWAPFYCPECDACYCAAHWTVVPVFDEDFPGWYDCAYGTCP